MNHALRVIGLIVAVVVITSSAIAAGVGYVIFDAMRAADDY